jgi:hypothetical protein
MPYTQFKTAIPFQNLKLDRLYALRLDKGMRIQVMLNGLTFPAVLEDSFFTYEYEMHFKLAEDHFFLNSQDLLAPGDPFVIVGKDLYTRLWGCWDAI